MRVWKCKQVADFDKSTTTVKEEINKNSSLDESDKLLRSILLHYRQEMVKADRYQLIHSTGAQYRIITKEKKELHMAIFVPSWHLIRMEKLQEYYGKSTSKIYVSFPLEVEFEFTTWAWVEATARMAFCSGCFYLYLQCLLPTARKGNVFTGVCHSVHNWPHGYSVTAHRTMRGRYTSY